MLLLFVSSRSPFMLTCFTSPCHSISNLNHTILIILHSHTSVSGDCMNPAHTQNVSECVIKTFSILFDLGFLGNTLLLQNVKFPVIEGCLDYVITNNILDSLIFKSLTRSTIKVMKFKAFKNTVKEIPSIPRCQCINLARM